MSSYIERMVRETLVLLACAKPQRSTRPTNPQPHTDLMEAFGAGNKLGELVMVILGDDAARDCRKRVWWKWRVGRRAGSLRTCTGRRRDEAWGMGGELS